MSEREIIVKETELINHIQQIDTELQMGNGGFTLLLEDLTCDVDFISIPVEIKEHNIIFECFYQAIDNLIDYLNIQRKDIGINITNKPNRWGITISNSDLEFKLLGNKQVLIKERDIRKLTINKDLIYNVGNPSGSIEIAFNKEQITLDKLNGLCDTLKECVFGNFVYFTIVTTYLDKIVIRASLNGDFEMVLQKE